jgi:putative nucleotidyltransferase with HDIG domain
MEHQAVLRELDELLRQTFALWEPGWVTFNWRAYTHDHTRRVTGLATNLCRQEGGDVQVTELAALLHDITKPYDGEYVVDAEGKRLVDDRGYWRNEIRCPAGHNAVTALYDELGLAGMLHNESGAILAEHLLRERGAEPDLVARVAETIRHHLVPPEDAPVESGCLYDADTIDANIGLPAFIRNIYIHLHYYDRRKAPDAPTIETLLRERPLAYLRPYIGDNLPQWNEGKRRDFIPRLRTEAGRRLAQARVERLAETFAWLGQELDAYAERADHTGVDVVLHYMAHCDEPSIAEETRYLAEAWLNGARNPRTRAFVQAIQREIEGVI